MSRFLRGKNSNNDNHYCCYRVTHLDGSKLEKLPLKEVGIQPWGSKGAGLVDEALMKLVRNMSWYGLYFDFLTCIYILKKCQSKLTTLYIVVVVATLWDPTMVCQTAEETTKAFLSFMCILLTDTLLFQQFKIRAKYHIWFGRCLMMCVCMSISLMDQPRCLRPIQTKVIVSCLDFSLLFASLDC